MFFFRTPKAQHVYKLRDQDIVSDVMDDFAELIPGAMCIYSGCFLCGAMIMTAFIGGQVKDMWEWPENCPPTELPVLMLLCPECDKKREEKSRTFGESN